MRWFTAVKLRQDPMFAQGPFERPAVPVRGTYAVAYMNRRCKATQRRRRGPCTATKSAALGAPIPRPHRDGKMAVMAYRRRSSANGEVLEA
jgi:hypothetical protein